MAFTSLNALSAFLSVARVRSFSRAARELGVSPSALSQSVRQLEAKVGTALLARTTRSVGLTQAGRRLIEEAGPGVEAALSALEHVQADAGQLRGSLRLTVPRISLSLCVAALIPRFLAVHPEVEVEVLVEDRLVDIVGEGYDAGVRLTEVVEKDMVQVRIHDAFRFVVVGSPAYLKRRGTPRRPEDLAKHDCIVFRSPTTGLPYHWELEKGRKEHRIPVKGPVVTNDSELMISLATDGVGLAYVAEPKVRNEVGARRLEVVLEAWAPRVPGMFLYFPSRAQVSPVLRAFLEVLRRG